MDHQDTKTDRTTGLSRRDFLIASGGAAAGFVFIFGLPHLARQALKAPVEKVALAAPGQPPFAPNAFIRVDRQSHVTLVMPMVEMGQGTYTSLTMLLAEELEIDPATVTLEHAPPNDALYANSILHSQTTGLSSSIRAFWQPLRQAGATVRTLFVTAAAAEWRVDPKSCIVKDGVVVSGDKKLAYGDLVDKASALAMPAPDAVELKSAEHFTVLGKPIKRLDSAIKINGAAKFGIDAMPDGVKFAAIAICPVFGGKLKSVDENAILAVKGVRQVVKLDDLVAVIADHFGAARKGIDAAAPQWDEGEHASIQMTDIVAQLEEAAKQPGAVARHDGSAPDVLASSTRKIDAVYQVPFLAHATMEPMNCTVHLQKDRCEIWVGTQAPTVTQQAVAALTGLPPEAVTINNHYIGGGFGRRLEPDGTLLAVRIAQHIDGPVKVIWSREEDIQHDMYRPYYYDRISGALDNDGLVSAWSHHILGSSVIARMLPPLYKNNIDFDAIEGAAEPPYAFPNIHVEYSRVEPPGIPTAFWRGVGPVHNIWVVESMMDELAFLAKEDSVVFRKRLLQNNPRALNVLTLAAEKAGWGRELPKGHGLGVSVQSAFGGYMADVAEIAVAEDGSIKVLRVVCAIDCGAIVNPNIIEAQVQGGTFFGLTAALRGEITLKNGRVEQANFDSYRPLRINEVPVVETHIVSSSEAPGGVGETPVSVVAPAVTNAIFAATGVRVRKLPIEAMKFTTNS